MKVLRVVYVSAGQLTYVLRELPSISCGQRSRATTTNACIEGIKGLQNDEKRREVHKSKMNREREQRGKGRGGREMSEIA